MVCCQCNCSLHSPAGPPPAAVTHARRPVQSLRWEGVHALVVPCRSTAQNNSPQSLQDHFAWKVRHRFAVQFFLGFFAFYLSSSQSGQELQQRQQTRCCFSDCDWGFLRFIARSGFFDIEEIFCCCYYTVKFLETYFRCIFFHTHAYTREIVKSACVYEFHPTVFGWLLCRKSPT